MFDSTFRPFAAVAAAATLAMAAPLARAAPDAALLAAAQAAQPAVIKTLESLVAIETGCADAAGLTKLAALLDARLKALGFQTERRKSPVGAGADTVIGTLAGSGSKKIMLQAHMDTVYEAGILQSQPYKQDGNKLYGPGIARRQGRHRGDPACAADPEGRGLEGLCAAHRAVQPGRRSRLAGLGRGHRADRGSPRYGAVVRADDGQGARARRSAAAGRRRHRVGDARSEGQGVACRRRARGGPQCHRRDFAPDASRRFPASR